MEEHMQMHAAVRFGRTDLRDCPPNDRFLRLLGPAVSECSKRSESSSKTAVRRKCQCGEHTPRQAAELVSKRLSKLRDVATLLFNIPWILGHRGVPNYLTYLSHTSNGDFTPAKESPGEAGLNRGTEPGLSDCPMPSRAWPGLFAIYVSHAQPSTYSNSSGFDNG
jgi:hypothetical protein